MSKVWYGFDFDGTIAYYDHWKSSGHTGDPIPAMTNKMRLFLQQGRDVRIFTARVTPDARDKDPQQEVNNARIAIDSWCLKYLGRTLPITATKDRLMLELYDDRAKQVIPNTGELVEDKLEAAEAKIRALENKINVWSRLGDVLEGDA